MRQCVPLRSPLGYRIPNPEVRQTDKWEPLDDARIYRVVMSSYIASGGDSFTMFRDAPSCGEEDASDIEVFENTLESLGDIQIPEVDRIIWK